MKNVVGRMIEKGHSDPEIRTALREAGWSKRAVDLSMNAWHRSDIGAIPKPSTTVRDLLKGVTVLVLLAFISAYMASLAFSLIDKFVPDPAETFINSYWRHAVTWPTANLIILSPLLIYLTRTWRPFASWVSTCTGFCVATILVGDAVIVAHGLLSGDATLAFLLKASVVVLIGVLAMISIRERKDA